MAITFDTARKHIVLDSASVSAPRIWSAWVDWHPANPQWPLAMRQAGGEAIGGGLYSPLYFFLTHGWRVRPMEADHDLDITGNLAVEGGGRPIVRTLGAYQVNAFLIVPERAQGIATSGGSGPSASEIADAVAPAVWQHMTGAAVAARLAEAWARLGLDASKPVSQSASQISFGDIVLAVAGTETVTVTRQ